MAGKSVKLSLRMPVEHGAWGILLVPFLCAASVAGRWNEPLLLSGVCALSLFLLRGSLEAQASPAPARTGSAERRIWLQPAHLILAAASGATAGLLVFLYRREQLLWVGFGAAVLYLLQRRLVEAHQAHRTEKRSLAAKVVGVALLTLTAPTAWIASHRALDTTGVKVWLLNLLFFLSSILYVKYRVRAILAHRDFRRVGECLAFAWPVFLYHFLLVAFLACWVILDLQPAAVLLAFVPGILRGNGLLFQLGRRFTIPRLGWNEMLHAAAFAVVLVLAFRVWG